MMRGAWLALLLAPVGLVAQTQVSRTFGVSADVSMRIWVPAGKVRVDTWDKDSIRVVGSIGRGAHFFGGGAGQGAKVGIELDDQNSTAIPQGDLTVTVPRRAHVWVKMTDGDVTALNTAGELEIITVTGTVTAQDAQGVVSVETIDAAVTLAGIAGQVRVHAGAGRVVLKDIHGSLTTTTISGNVELRGTGLPDSRIETIGGSIVVRGVLGPEALVDLETHNGPITLYVDRAAAPSLALTSRAGVVKNPVGNGKATAGQIIAHSFKGSINVVPVTGIEGKKAGTPP